VGYSYFPADGRVCLLNIDFERPHRFVLHHAGSSEQTQLAPAEFRVVDAARGEDGAQ
jgi:hypothetical protein